MPSAYRTFGYAIWQKAILLTNLGKPKSSADLLDPVSHVDPKAFDVLNL